MGSKRGRSTNEGEGVKRLRVKFGTKDDQEAEKASGSSSKTHSLGIEEVQPFVEIDEDDVAHLTDRAYDFSKLELKPDHENRPIWVSPDKRIFLESFSPLYRQAYDFLIAVAEPVSRPQCIHEYVLTLHSLYAAVSIGLRPDTIVKVLDRLSKVKLSPGLEKFIHETTENCGKLKLVIQDNKFLLESPHRNVLSKLIKDDLISKARKESNQKDGTKSEDNFILRQDVSQKNVAQEIADVANTKELAKDGEVIVPLDEADKELHAIEIWPNMIEHVKQRCLPGKGGLNYPILEEYDFQHDKVNPNLMMELKPTAKLRSYQEKSLSKMFSNGRARSGVIVLPCGAGKSLTGVAAAARVKKSILCLCLNSVSVDQWRHQFLLWTNLHENQVCKFTAENKTMFSTDSGVLVTTYSMLTHEGRRSEAAAKILGEMQRREWGLMLLDEVHVVPAETFRKVISIIKAHCKLGLTATLVREDNLIDHLNFLIGPKLYEANWLDLVNQGYLANVQCAEVWCPMTKEFFAEYLKKDNARKRELLYVMNPIKFMTCQFLIEYHEIQRRDKVIVFSDNIFALREYALKLRRPFIYGATAHNERTRILHHFKHSSDVNTIFISRVGDNSIDIPEANVIIQIASHAGARRQEAQRLGRILRPKQYSPSTAGEFNAFFYSLVSKDTQEMYYSTKRQQFLIDQGYSFKVITNLLDTTDKSRFAYSKKEEQIDLLSRILTVGEVEQGDEVLPTDNEETIKSKAIKAKRSVGSLAGLSGAGGMTYMEYKTGEGKSKPAPKRSSLQDRHFLFRFRRKYQK